MFLIFDCQGHLSQDRVRLAVTVAVVALKVGCQEEICIIIFLSLSFQFNISNDVDACTCEDVAHLHWTCANFYDKWFLERQS